MYGKKFSVKTKRAKHERTEADVRRLMRDFPKPTRAANRPSPYGAFVRTNSSKISRR